MGLWDGFFLHDFVDIWVHDVIPEGRKEGDESSFEEVEGKSGHFIGEF